nr:reverse transcriptase domain-containing protein [Tanacetum cinerariifolium]
MTTRSVGHATASPREGRKGRRTVEEVVKLLVDLVIREIEEFMLKNLLPTILAQVGNKGNKGSNQGNRMNQNDDAINDNILGNVRNVIVNNNQRGFTYKEFLACKPKEYDGKGCVIVYIRWIEKMELVQDISRRYSLYS